ncbi:D-glycero-beta-D-manno-heptose-1,7-bisphosphate 7-phosphatase, partial [Pseudomonas aeruginosa]
MANCASMSRSLLILDRDGVI